MHFLALFVVLFGGFLAWGLWERKKHGWSLYENIQRRPEDYQINFELQWWQKTINQIRDEILAIPFHSSFPLVHKLNGEFPTTCGLMEGWVSEYFAEVTCPECLKVMNEAGTLTTKQTVALFESPIHVSVSVQGIFPIKEV